MNKTAFCFAYNGTNEQATRLSSLVKITGWLVRIIIWGISWDVKLKNY